MIGIEMEAFSVISSGGNDRCLFQWEATKTRPRAAGAVKEGKETDVSLSVKKKKEVEEEEEEEGHDEEEELSPPVEGDQFMAVKPWLGAIFEPSHAPVVNPTPPEDSLQLEWVYGYQAQESRNNLRYSSTGDIVYHSAAVGIAYDRKRKVQRFHLGHEDDIVSLAMDNLGMVACTASLGKDPAIRIWDASTTQLAKEFKGIHKRGIPCLAFSPDNRSIVSIGGDDDHTVVILSTSDGTWRDGRQVASQHGDKGLPLFAHWKDNSTLVTGGLKHVLFWTVNGKAFTRKNGVFGDIGKLQNILVAANVGSGGDTKVVTGGESGEIYVWSDNKVVQAIKAHDKGLTAMYGTDGGLVTGGMDGKVCMWTHDLKQMQTYDMKTSSQSPPHCHQQCVLGREGKHHPRGNT